MKRKVMIGLGAAALLALCIGSIPAFADDTAKQKLVVEMFKVLNIHDLTDKLASTTTDQIKAEIVRKDPTVKPEVLNAVAEATRESFVEITPYLNRFSGDFLVRNFTTEELSAILAFYKTPVGRKSAALLPKMQQEMMVVLMPLIEKAQRNVVVKVKQRLHAMGYKL